jgi:hypothetical protein
MVQDGTFVENMMHDRRHKMRKHGAVRGRPSVPHNEQ